MKKPIIVTATVLVAIILIALIFDFGRKENPVLDINPDLHMAEINSQSASSSSDMPIVVDNIKDNQTISNPIQIRGKARGSWFFEGSFPIKLVDVNANVLGTAIATAEGEWMTTDFVNFTAHLEYNKSTSTSRALLILSKDNPSGIPEFDQSIFIPVILK